jgi:hypothetical protein
MYPLTGRDMPAVKETPKNCNRLTGFYIWVVLTIMSLCRVVGYLMNDEPESFWKEAVLSFRTRIFICHNYITYAFPNLNLY